MGKVKEMEEKGKYSLVKGDMCDLEVMLKVMEDYEVDGMMDVGGERDVDRSMKDGLSLGERKVMGRVCVVEGGKI